MRSEYFDYYVEQLEKVFCFSYERHISLKYVESAISKSSFFRSIETDELSSVEYINEKQLLKSVFPFMDESSFNASTYNSCMWAAEAYIWIQSKTKQTFEAIFLYIPLEEMYKLFVAYHEMDFSHIVDEFVDRQNKKSVLSILLKNYKISVRTLSNETGISYNTLMDLKTRRRDISKLNVSSALKLANRFNVRPETLAELRQGE